MSSERANLRLVEKERNVASRTSQQFAPTAEAVEPDFAENQVETTAERAPQSCPRCFGSGIEVVRGKGARNCACRQAKVEKSRVALARIPPRYLNCSLENYYPVHGKHFSSQGRAHRFAYEMARGYPGVSQGLLYVGPVGVGKTHLAVAILRELLKLTDAKCLFYQFGALLKAIQNSYSPIAKTSELTVLAPVFEADVLVLDELGASKPTDWVQDTMMHIINTRYNEKRLTIFTTNYLDDRKTEREETLQDRIGVRLRSRLYEMCRTVIVEGDDFRRTFDR